MSDNLRRYRAIHNALKQAYPAQPKGNVARHLHTLAALISGIVGSKSTQLPTIATKVPDGIKPGGGVFFTVCGPLAKSSSLTDVGARHGWQRRGARVQRLDDPCGL